MTCFTTSSQRNEDTEEGCSLKLRPYPIRGVAAKHQTIDQVSSEDEDDHLNVEGYSSDSTVNKMFSSGRDYIERPANHKIKQRNQIYLRTLQIKTTITNNKRRMMLTMTSYPS